MMPLLSLFGDAPAACVHQFLGLIPWFQYLNLNKDCSINIDLANNADWNQLWLIGIAAIDDLLRIAGAAAVALIIYGAIRYITSQGNPENIKNAQRTIVGAIVGLVIAFFATDAVNFIGSQLGGTSANGLPNIVADGNLVTTILDIVYSIIGALSVIMIIFGGFKYITSGGDSAKVSEAKNTILYSIIGVVVAAFAFIITNFILVTLSS